MFNKLRQNYKWTNIQVRVALVAAYVFYSWQKNCTISYSVAQTLSAFMPGAAYSGALVVATGLIVSVMIGLIIMLIVPPLARWFLNISHFYSVPRAEYGLLANLFCTIYFAVCGVLNLINLFTPLLLGWGGTLFPFVVSLGCVIGFYHVTSRLYFNDVTRPYYFRNAAIAYFVCALVFEVLL